MIDIFRLRAIRKRRYKKQKLMYYLNRMMTNNNAEEIVDGICDFGFVFNGAISKSAIINTIEKLINYELNLDFNVSVKEYKTSLIKEYDSVYSTAFLLRDYPDTSKIKIIFAKHPCTIMKLGEDFKSDKHSIVTIEDLNEIGSAFKYVKSN